MRVTVRLFARLREAAGTAECPCEVPSDAVVSDVWRVLTTSYPALEPFGGSISAAINADFAKPSSRLQEGDEVAFLPPVSGGVRTVSRKKKHP
jgi:molybdopterin converting factor subunit 1